MVPPIFRKKEDARTYTQRLLERSTRTPKNKKSESRLTVIAEMYLSPHMGKDALSKTILILLGIFIAHLAGIGAAKREKRFQAVIDQQLETNKKIIAVRVFDNRMLCVDLENEKNGWRIVNHSIWSLGDKSIYRLSWEQVFPIYRPKQLEESQ